MGGSKKKKKKKKRFRLESGPVCAPLYDCQFVCKSCMRPTTTRRSTGPLVPNSPRSVPGSLRPFSGCVENTSCG